MGIVRKQKSLLLAIVVVAAAAWVYAPGLTGPFLFDDIGNFVKDGNIQIRSLDASELREAAFPPSRERFFLGRPIPRLSFALNYYLAGQEFEPWWFKVTNVAIHAINGVLVFALSLLLCRARLILHDASSRAQGSNVPYWVAGVTTVLWTLHPIQLTSVLYVVQRMTSMAGMFVFIGLILFVLGRQRLNRSEPWGFTIMLAGVLGCTVLGFWCKQNAALLPFFATLVEVFFFSRKCLTPWVRRRLHFLYATLLTATILAVLVVLFKASDYFIGLYNIRDFTLVERLLTEARVMFFYLGLIVFPRIQDFSLFHDDIAVSTGLLAPTTTIVALVALAFAVVVGLWGCRRRYIVSFAILWYLTGHAIESTVLALEIAHEHRNYVPSFGLFFATAYGVFWLVEHRPELRRTVLALCICGVAAFSFVTHSRATLWKDRESIVYITARNHPQAPRAQMELALFHETLGSDARQVFAGYQRAAATSKNVFPIIKLQRIVYGLGQQLAAGEQQADDGVYTGSADLLSSELFLNMEFLAELDAQADKEARRRIVESAVDAETMVGFLELRRCVLTRGQFCLPAERAIEWHRLIIARDNLMRMQRASLLLNLAMLYAYVGDTGPALDYAEQASEVSKDRVGFVLELAELHELLGDRAAATSILTPLLEREDVTESQRNAVQAVIARLAAPSSTGVEQKPRGS